MISQLIINNEKTINIDFLYLDLNTCDRCQETETNLDEAVSVFSEVSKCLNYKVLVNKINVNTKELAEVHRFESSPTIRVNGQDILGVVKENSCPACSAISGQETACRVFEYDGKAFTEPPTAMILEGILRVLFNKNTDGNTEQFVLPQNLEKFYLTTDKKTKSCSFNSTGCC